MIALIQRVSEACVRVDGAVVGEIAGGLLALVAIQPDDTSDKASRLLEKMLNYRIFPDEAGRMNCSLRDTGGGLLLVSQFTLAADTKSGLRPSFSTAAPPALGEALFGYLLLQAQQLHGTVASGRFGADMQVHLVNDGPVTFLLQT